MDRICHYDSPLGGITIAGSGDALTGLWFDGQKHFPDLRDCLYEPGTLPVFREAERWLDLYFSGRDPGFTPKLEMRTTAFRKKVWEILLDIPYGKTVTYGEVARRTAAVLHVPGMSAQAVGGAVGHNAVSLMIPCHRVLGADGRLTGYAGGTERKRMLLEMEKGNVPSGQRLWAEPGRDAGNR